MLFIPNIVMHLPVLRCTKVLHKSLFIIAAEVLKDECWACLPNPVGLRACTVGCDTSLVYSWIVHVTELVKLELLEYN